jgi:hypothetical protein
MAIFVSIDVPPQVDSVATPVAGAVQRNQTSFAKLRAAQIAGGAFCPSRFVHAPSVVNGNVPVPEIVIAPEQSSFAVPRHEHVNPVIPQEFPAGIRPGEDMMPVIAGKISTGAVRNRRRCTRSDPHRTAAARVPPPSRRTSHKDRSSSAADQCTAGDRIQTSCSIPIVPKYGQGAPSARRAGIAVVVLAV